MHHDNVSGYPDNSIPRLSMISKRYLVTKTNPSGLGFKTTNTKIHVQKTEGSHVNPISLILFRCGNPSPLTFGLLKHSGRTRSFLNRAPLNEDRSSSHYEALGTGKGSVTSSPCFKEC